MVHHANLGRRAVLGAGLVAGIGRYAPAATRPAGATSVINGNLALPLDPDAPLSADTVRQVRATGLTAAKQTLGGSGSRSFAQTMDQIAACDLAITHNPAVLRKVRGAADLSARDPRLGVIYSFEAAEMLEGKVDNIDRFRARDVLVMGLSYNLPTPFASGVLAKVSGGLTDLGRQAVARMNALGITLDVSHSDEPPSLTAIAVSTRPALVTHAGCAEIHPHPRNKSNRLLRALAERGGVVGIYELSYLTEYPRQPTLAVYFAHLIHALNVCGEDHVGIGSDASLTRFDTSPAAMRDWNAETARRKATGVAAPGEGPPPFVIGLNRPDRMAVIADRLRRRGYSARTMDKVVGGNFARVFQETWRAG